MNLKNTVILFCLILAGPLVRANRLQEQIDSVAKVLKHQPISQAIEDYMRLATRVIYVDPGKVTEMSRLIETSASRIDYRFASTRVKVLNLVILINESDYDSAKVLLQEVKAEAEQNNDKLGLIHYYLNEGIIRKRLGEYEASAQSYYKALEFADELKDDRFKLALYNNLGALYNSLGDYKSAQKVILEAIRIYRQVNEESATSIGNMYSNLAVAYKNARQLDSALYYYEKAREDFEALGNVMVSGIYCNMGILYGDLKQYDRAEVYLQKALRLTRENKQANYEVNVLNSLAEIRTTTKDHRQAIEYAKQAMQLAREKGFVLAESQSLKYLHQANASLGRYDKAYELLMQATMLNDSIFNIEKDEVIKEIREKYETDKKDQEILLANTRIEEQRQWSYYLWATIFAFGIFIIFIWFLYVRTGKLSKKIALQAKAIEVQNANLEKANQVKDKLFAIVSHDLRAPVSSLHSLLLLMNSPGHSAEKMQLLKHELQTQLHHTSDLMETLLHWAKTQMKGWGVKQEVVEVSRIMDTLSQQFHGIATQKHIRLNLEVDKELIVTADEQLLHIVLYNLVSNAIKFTPANGKVWVDINSTATSTGICVCDNGPGISAENSTLLFNETNFDTTLGTANEKGFGLGLKICIELVRQLQGTLTIRSEQGKGSCFCITLPA